MNNSQRLAAIEVTQARIVAMLEALKEDLHKQVEADEEQRRVIFGDGNGRKGLVVRLDRLEQTAKRAWWLFHAIVGALIPLAVAAVWSAVK